MCGVESVECLCVGGVKVCVYPLSRLTGVITHLTWVAQRNALD